MNIVGSFCKIIRVLEDLLFHPDITVVRTHRWLEELQIMALSWEGRCGGVQHHTVRSHPRRGVQRSWVYILVLICPVLLGKWGTVLSHSPPRLDLSDNVYLRGWPGG